VIAVDTNILIYAHREESPWHEEALVAVESVAKHSWAIPWPCVHEFIAITTHPRVFDPPTPMGDARKAIDAWLASPTLSLLAELPGYWEVLSELLRHSRVAGPRVPDARIAALCLQHAIDELWSADRDFSRFAALFTRNPLVDQT